MNDTAILGRPGTTAGMRHIALFVPDLDSARHFYVDLLGMEVEWQPDASNVYLTSGSDNLALHHSPDWEIGGLEKNQRLDHIGFIIDHSASVDEWHAYLQQEGVPMKSAPRTHRDGARSFYCLDPAGTLVQLIYHPPLSKGA